MTLKRAAFRYAEMGWAVFPLGRRAKVPAIPTAHREDDPLRGQCTGQCGLEGHGLYDATTDFTIIERWWTAWPDANIGLRTGLSFDVLDVDGPDGERSLQEAWDGGPGLAEIDEYGPVALTGKGFHVYLAPTGEGNRTRILPGLDWRGRGGYVVAPPSIHPDGPIYQWAAHPTRPLVVTPAWLLKKVRPPAPVVPPPMPPSSGGTQNRGRYSTRALEAETAGVLTAAIGERNDRLNRAAYNLGQLVAGGDLQADIVAEALLRAAAGAGLSGREATATITSGLRSGMTSPRSAPR